jgi:acyl-[acyl-carrier-protein]-phospholipid O-acyltransferase / long-chain-fatty-acid--[acyl-carrier-protein] ligase
MSNLPNSFAEWQDYPLTLDAIHIAWLKKKSSTTVAVANIEGVDISHKKILTGVLLFSKKIALVNDQE